MSQLIRVILGLPLLLSSGMLFAQVSPRSSEDGIRNAKEEQLRERIRSVAETSYRGYQEHKWLTLLRDTRGKFVYGSFNNPDYDPLASPAYFAELGDAILEVDIGDNGPLVRQALEILSKKIYRFLVALKVESESDSVIVLAEQDRMSLLDTYERLYFEVLNLITDHVRQSTLQQTQSLANRPSKLALMVTAAYASSASSSQNQSLIQNLYVIARSNADISKRALAVYSLVRFGSDDVSLLSTALDVIGKTAEHPVYRDFYEDLGRRALNTGLRQNSRDTGRLIADLAREVQHDRNSLSQLLSLPIARNVGCAQFLL